MKDHSTDHHAARWVAGFAAAAGGALWITGGAWAKRFYYKNFVKKRATSVWFDGELEEVTEEWVLPVVQSLEMVRGSTVFVVTCDDYTSDIIMHPIDGCFGTIPAALELYTANPSQVTILFYPTSKEALSRISMEGYLDSLIASQPELRPARLFCYLNPRTLKCYQLHLACE
eukprot:TRINITY_DN5217_c0_g1_i1.p1 TRINITY_DN5217_c0_g1~~TRINITY_DN5217_c0_g1_i1.p1  ORF type:complete len:172 (+),score=31.34 TRINITY_DN5217_c0_g1_i1:209-724(+)